MQFSKLLTASAASLTLAFSPLFAQTVFAQAAGTPSASSLSGSGVTATVSPPASPAPAGVTVATTEADGGLTKAAVVGGVVAVGAIVAVAASNSGSGSTGTTGTTGTR